MSRVVESRFPGGRGFLTFTEKAVQVVLACDGSKVEMPPRSIYSNEYVTYPKLFGDVKMGWDRDSFIGEGILVLTMISKLNKEKIEKEKIQSRVSGMSKYLRADKNIELQNSELRAVAREIMVSLPVNLRADPVSYLEQVISWIEKNIEYIVLPPELISRVSRIISELSITQKLDVYKILSRSFPKLDQTAPMEVSRSVKDKLPATAYLWDEKKLAYEIMKEAVDRWRIFQMTWSEYGLSAAKTLQERAGKCVGINYLFIALARLGGVPAREITGGYLVDSRDNGGRHAWAAVFLPPYGWVEVDATNHEGMQKFRHHIHAYEFLYSSKNKLPLAEVNSESRITDDKLTAKIEETIHRLENNKAWVWERKKYREDAEFLKGFIANKK